MMNTICYKLDTPVVYNKGTKWESSEDTFLECYVRGTREDAEALCVEKNLTATNRVYFVDQQEIMY